MTEYWISKKQYWCKYCNIWIRDDAPSRKQHETGLKHQGSKERYIRELYKSGNQAKRDKLTEAAEMARINAAAEAAHAKDTHVSAARPSLLSTIQSSSAASSSKPRDSKPTDKWANYSSAKDLGFDDEDTQKTAYEIEQEIKGRAAPAPGAWQEVEEIPQGVEYEQGEGSVISGKRKLGEYGIEGEEEEGENFRFEQKRKPVRDPYDDEDYDPKKALGRLKLKQKETPAFGNGVKGEVKEDEEITGGLDREAWTGRLELQAGGPEGKRTEKSREGLVYVEGGGWVKAPDEQEAKLEDGEVTNSTDVKPAVHAPEDSDTKPDILTQQPLEPEAPSSGLFKKRRPPPGNRKK